MFSNLLVMVGSPVFDVHPQVRVEGGWKEGVEGGWKDGVVRG
jgi:hypothetical protein